MHEKNLDAYTHIIIDEVHERDLLTDTVLLLVRGLLPQYPKVKIVLMSATMDCTALATYFVQDPVAGTTPLPPVLHVGGKTFPVTQFYLEDLPRTASTYDYVERSGVPSIETDLTQLAIDLILAIHAREQHAITSAANTTPRVYGGILVFLPGMAEIDAFYRVLEEALVASQVRQAFSLIPCHSSLEQGPMFEAATATRQKVILATNIAESSITVPDIV